MSAVNLSVPKPIRVRGGRTAPSGSPPPSVAALSPRLAITYISPDDLTVSRLRLRNDKRGRQQECLQRNLRRFGCVLPVLVDENGVVIHGHAIVAAAKSIDLEAIPTVTITGLSEPEIRALRISLHKVEDLSSWDNKALTTELAALAEIDTDLLSFTGFSTEEIDVLLETNPEDSTPEPAPAVSRLGDMWAFDTGHQLACGSALDPAVFTRVMNGAAADLVLTDPPYNVKIAGNVSTNKNAREFAAASGEMTPEEFTAFLATAFRLAAQHSREGSIHLHCMDWRHMPEMLAAGHQVYDALINLVVWAKTNAGLGSLWRSQHELIFAWKHGTAPHTNNVQLGREGRWRSNVWTYQGANSFGRNRKRDLAGHVTPKSVAMLYDAILDVTKRQDVVLDCFCGGGTTLVAAHRAKRIGIGIEIDPVYVDVAIRRMEVITGKPARHAETGLTFSETTAQRQAADAGVSV